MRVAGAVLGLGLALLAGSARADGKDGEPVPAGYRAVRSSRGELIAGSITLGVTWAASATVGALTINDPALSIPLFVPVVGPFVEVGIVTYRGRYDDPLGVAVADLALLLDGFAQTAGLVLLLVGARTPAARLVKAPSVEARVVPMGFAAGGAGVGVFGRF